eukprot:3039368-Prymnesium_polylepis.1
MTPTRWYSAARAAARGRRAGRDARGDEPVPHPDGGLRVVDRLRVQRARHAATAARASRRR